VRRVLSGSLAHLAPSSLLRLLSATAPSGVLEISCEAGDLRLETVKGKVAAPGPEELRRVGRILRAGIGSFRFEPRELRPIVGEALTLSALADAAEETERVWDPALGGDVDLDRLLAGEVMELSRPAPVADIHVLPVRSSQNPLDELLTELGRPRRRAAVDRVAVVSKDPRIWRGALATSWRPARLGAAHRASPAASLSTAQTR
jgi:hypothetical protein